MIIPIGHIVKPLSNKMDIAATSFLFLSSSGNVYLFFHLQVAADQFNNVFWQAAVSTS